MGMKRKLNRLGMYLVKGDSVMIHSGKYISYIAQFERVSKCGLFAIVKLDLNPKRIIRTLRFRVDNISAYSEC